MREFSRYRKVTLPPSPFFLSFFILRCVESCFLLVLLEQDFIVGVLRRGTVLKNFTVFTLPPPVPLSPTEQIVSRTQPHITRLENRKKCEGKEGARRYGTSERGKEQEVYLVQLSVCGGCFISFISVLS